MHTVRMTSLSRPYEYLAMFAAAVGQGHMDCEDADGVLSSWWTGLTTADINPAKGVISQMLATGTPEEVKLRQGVAEAMFGVRYGLDVDDSEARRRAVDWLESLRERLPD